MAKKTLTIAKKLDQLAELQAIHTKIDQIQVLKGDLPMEVSDLEDEIEGMHVRLQKVQNKIDEANTFIADSKHKIKDIQALTTKYERQLDTVKNNREFDALSKEVEIQKLDVQILEKKIKEYTYSVGASETELKELNDKIELKSNNLDIKKKELDIIVAETIKEEEELVKKAEEIEEEIEPKLLTAYKRIRSSYRNGLAVVNVEREACGGCFGKIPPQSQAEIKLKKKITTCEHCGRILVDVIENDSDEDFIPASAM